MKIIVKIIKEILWWMWLIVDVKGCLLATTTEEERERMGIKL